MRWIFLVVFVALSCGVNYSLAQVLDGIESVEYDAANDRWLVSSSSGVLYTEDHGETFQNLGMAQASHAMEIVDGYLYTLDNNILRGYELTSGLQTSSLNLSASFANGMGGRSGELFVSDFSAGAIFRINVSDPNNVFISDTAENIGFFPNGLVVDDALNRLVIVGWGNNAPLASMDLDTFEISYEVTTTLNNLDGIDIDEWGYFFVSSWGPPKITRFDDNFQPTLADLFEGPEIANPGDISYSISQQKIGVPSTGNNSLVFLDIWGCTDEEACNFNEFAWKLDNSCLYGDDCGPCDGNALPDGACDCDGNTPMAGYDCNGDCLSDENQNGVCDFLELEEIQSQIENGGFCGEGTIWDDVSQTCIIDELFCGWQPDGDGDMLIGVSDLLMLLAVFGDTDLDQDGIFDSADDCVGSYDECGVCNGDGPSIPVIESIEVLYDSVYAEAIDEWWVFEVGTDTTFTLLCELYGCTDPTAENFNEEATNDDGSCIYPWACGDPVSYHGYDYETVLIGEQCWFAENLRTENYRDSTPILTGISGYDWFDLTDSGAYLIHNDDNEVIYGHLYNWWAVHDERGLCPSGWSVPSDEQFISLYNQFPSIENASGALKSDGTIEDGDGLWYAPNIGANNSSGFSALPSGSYICYQQSGGWCIPMFQQLGYFNYLWTSTESSEQENAFHTHLYSYSEPNQVLVANNKAQGLSVRCLKD